MAATLSAAEIPSRGTDKHRTGRGERNMDLIRSAGDEQMLSRMEGGLRGYSRTVKLRALAGTAGPLPEVKPKPLKARFHCAALPHAAHLEVCLPLPSLSLSTPLTFSAHRSVDGRRQYDLPFPAALVCGAPSHEEKINRLEARRPPRVPRHNGFNILTTQLTRLSQS